jgi:hypothetical protein
VAERIMRERLMLGLGLGKGEGGKLGEFGFEEK